MSVLTLAHASDLKEARLGAQLSQTRLSTLTGIAQPRLSAYENGHLSPSLDTLAKIGAAIHAHLAFQSQCPAASEDEQVRQGQVKRLEAMSAALFNFLKAEPQYEDLVHPLVALLATAQARIEDSAA